MSTRRRLLSMTIPTFRGKVHTMHTIPTQITRTLLLPALLQVHSTWVHLEIGLPVEDRSPWLWEARLEEQAALQRAMLMMVSRAHLQVLVMAIMLRTHMAAAAAPNHCWLPISARRAFRQWVVKSHRHMLPSSGRNQDRPRLDRRPFHNKLPSQVLFHRRGGHLAAPGARCIALRVVIAGS